MSLLTVEQARDLGAALTDLADTGARFRGRREDG